MIPLTYQLWLYLTIINYCKYVYIIFAITLSVLTGFTNAVETLLWVHSVLYLTALIDEEAYSYTMRKKYLLDKKLLTTFTL